MSAEALNLRNLIADLSAHGSPDPRAVATRVIEKLSAEEYRAALEIALPSYVRVVNNAHRSPSVGNPSRSAKVGAIRAWHERMLLAEVDPSGSGNDWKRLGDCTRDDVLALAAHRRKIADENRAAAQRYERLASEMNELGVEHVSDLSASVLSSVLDEVAA